MALQTGFEDVVQTGVAMSEHTWFKLGGAAEYFSQPESVDQLSAIVQRCREADVPVKLLGGGSNVLVRDAGVKGMIVRLAGDEFRKISRAVFRRRAAPSSDMSFRARCGKAWVAWRHWSVFLEPLAVLCTPTLAVGAAMSGSGRAMPRS